MTGRNGAGTLEAVEWLEAALGGRTERLEAVEAAIAEAHAEAEALLADAAYDGELAGKLRRQSILAAAERDASAARDAARAEAEELRASLDARRGDLVEELATFVHAGPEA